MRKIIFIFMIFSLVSFSNSEFLGIRLLVNFNQCDKNDREHLETLKNENQKMIEIYNKLIQKFDKGGENYYKLKQKLVSSQENWLKNFYEGLKDLTKDVYFVNLCAAEQFRVSSEVSFTQQRILELTDEYKKYLD
ncbi:hypothetical protein [Leptotrichia buccalis]